MKKFTADTDTNLKDFTDSVYPQGSFYLSSLLRAYDVRVNGVKVNSNVPLKAGDEVTYYTTPSQESRASHIFIYEDEYLYAADKYSGVSTEALAHELSLIPVHRLDRNTCGVIIFAKTKEVKERLIEQFSARAVQKTYLCFAKNNFKKPHARLTAYLCKDSKESKVRISDVNKRGYLEIVTEYSVLAEYGDYALAEVILHTGKTHQIRAHLAHIGCPVLGDEKYGDEALNKKYRARRQILVSEKISFTLFGKQYNFKSSFVPKLPQQ